jgi:hypothetical protein
MLARVSRLQSPELRVGCRFLFKLCNSAYIYNATKLSFTLHWHAAPKSLPVAGAVHSHKEPLRRMCRRRCQEPALKVASRWSRLSGTDSR